jgi:hypothetical protein
MSEKLIRTIQNGHKTSDLYGQLNAVMDMILILKEKELDIKTQLQKLNDSFNVGVSK